MKIKKAKANNYYKSNKEKPQNVGESVMEIFLKMRKFIKEIILTLKIKIRQMQIERKKEHMKNFYYKRNSCII